MGETQGGRSRAHAPVENALDVLDAFEGEAQALSMSEIMEITHMHKSAAYRLVKVLVTRGYLTREAASATYRLGPRLITLASRRPQELALIARARPLLERLSEQTGLTARLCVLEGTDAICLLKVNAAHGPRHLGFGVRVRACCTSPGKSLLAALEDAEIARRYRGYPFEAYTARTTSSMPALMREIAAVRAQGYASTDSEMEEGFCSAAMAVAVGGTMASVSVCSARPGQGVADVREALGALRECAQALA